MPSRIWYIFRRGILFDPFDSIRIAVSFKSIVEAIFRLQEDSAAAALATFRCFFFLFPFIDNEGDEEPLLRVSLVRTGPMLRVPISPSHTIMLKKSKQINREHTHKNKIHNDVE